MRTTHPSCAGMGRTVLRGPEKVHDVDRAGTDQRLGDLQGVLARVGLGDVQLINIYAQPLGIGGIQRVFCVDESRQPACLLRLSDQVKRYRGLA